MNDKNGKNIDFISLLRTLSEKYDSYKNKNNFFIYLWEDMKFSPSDFRAFYNRVSFELSVVNKNQEVIQMIRKMYNAVLEYDAFYNSFFQRLTHHDLDKDTDELYQLFEMIDNFLSQKNNLYLLIYYMIDVKDILYKKVSVYNKMVSNYCLDCLKGNSEFNLKSVYNFNRMYAIYKGILRQPDYIVQLIHSGDEKIIKFLYYVLRNNRVTIDGLEKHLAKFSDDHDVCKFISRYSKYYSICLKKDEEKKQDERFNTAYNTIRNYLDGNYYNMDYYCKSINISKGLFEKYVGFMKEINNPIYEEYSDFSEKQRSLKFGLLMDKVRTIVSLIRNGIIEDGEVRDFDLLDYYSYTKLSFDELKRVINGKVSNSDYTALSLFCSKYDDKVLTSKARETLFGTSINFNCTISTEGDIVDTGYEVNEYDKQHVLNMLESQNIPLTSSTFSLMLKRYINKKLSENIKNTIK